MAEIYQLPEDATVFPDSTWIKMRAAGTGLIPTRADSVLLPESANNIEAEIDLAEVLEGIQRNSAYPTFKPDWRDVKRFGIQQGAEDVIQNILERYVKVCREKRQEKLVFGSGPQYSFLRLSMGGIAVTLGDYGLYFATLVEASRDSAYKSYLLQKGRDILKSRQGFFVNPPGTTVVAECLDGILLVNRGPTADHPYSYYQVAGGHYAPTKAQAQKLIPIDELTAYQLEKETGLDIRKEPDSNKVSGHSFNGLAFATGYELKGTEKLEVLTSISLNISAAEVAKSIQDKAEHRWETRQLLAVPRERIGEVIEGTLDASKPPTDLNEFMVFGKPEKPQKNPNSVSYWLPVGITALFAHLGPDVYSGHLPQRWQSIRR